EHLNISTGTQIEPEVIQALLEHRTFVTPTLIQTAIQVNALDWPDAIDNQRARLTTPPEIWSDIARSLASPTHLPYFGSTARRRETEIQKAKFKQLWDAG